MGQKWIDDETTLRSVAPEVLEQEERVAQQRRLIDQLDAAGHRDLANEARQVLGNMCNSLEKIRREARAAKIEQRERSFSPVSEEEAMEHVMRACPL